MKEAEEEERVEEIAMGCDEAKEEVWEGEFSEEEVWEGELSEEVDDGSEPG